jgi:FAD/FMN-containing dehydrogenase
MEVGVAGADFSFDLSHEGGTLIKMSRMNSILDIGADTVTVQAGAIAIDVAHELQKHGMQFYVNTEIGSLSVGSASCAGTKDASMPGEYGQVGSYITRIKMVLPSGELLEASDDQPNTASYQPRRRSP